MASFRTNALCSLKKKKKKHTIECVHPQNISQMMVILSLKKQLKFYTKCVNRANCAWLGLVFGGSMGPVPPFHWRRGCGCIFQLLDGVGPLRIRRVFLEVPYADLAGAVSPWRCRAGWQLEG